MDGFLPQKLVDLLHRLATSTVAGLLTDGAAIARLTAGAGVLGLGDEGSLLAVDGHEGLVPLNLVDGGLNHRSVASAVAGLAGHGVAIAPLTASTDVNGFTRLEDR